MSRFRATETGIAGVKLIQRTMAEDQRGAFGRLFCVEALATLGWEKPIAQINLSRTQRRGVVRGMHFQRPPHAEAKFITCLQGCIWDVAVDLRRGSPTFLQWRAFELSPDNQQSLLIPEGCAHGFQALTEACEMLYVHSEFFAPDADDGVNPNDPMLDISWPLPVSGLSDKDARRPFLSHDFEGMTL